MAEIAGFYTGNLIALLELVLSSQQLFHFLPDLFISCSSRVFDSLRSQGFFNCMKRLGFKHLLHKRLNRMKFIAGWGERKFTPVTNNKPDPQSVKRRRRRSGLDLLTYTGQECARWHCRRSSLSPAVSCRPFPPPLSTPPSCSSSKNLLQLSSWAFGTASACVKSMHPCCGKQACSRFRALC